MAISKIQTVTVNLAVQNNSVVVAGKALTTSQIAATSFLTGPTGATGATGATGPTGPGVPTGGTTGQVLAKIDATNYNTQWVPASTGTGTVTSVAVATANGISGTVANSTTTPSITIAVGAITPTSVAASGTVTGSNLSGTNTGDQTTVSGNAGTATTLQTPRTIGTLTGDVTTAGSTFNGSANNTNATVLATVNSNVGSFGSATQVPTYTVNAKGLTTAASNVAIQIAESQVTNLTTDLAAKQASLTLTTTGTSGASTLVGSTLNIPQYSGGGTAVSGPAIFVASSTATTKQKAFADYTCTGTNDHTTINTALTALPSGKGTVILSAGAFSAAGTINIAANQALIGQGVDATTITGTATTFDVIHMGNRQASGTMSNFMGLKDLSVSSASGANSFSTVWADGMGIGSYIENVKASEGKYNFRLTDLDQCSVTNIKGYNPRTASIYVEVGLENTWGNVAFYSPSMALSDNSSTCLLIDASAAQTSPNLVDRLTIYGALFYASTGLTGTTGIKATVGATSFGIYGSLFENPQVHVALTGTTFMSFNNCSFIQNSGVSTDIIQYNTNNHTTTFTDCRFQQATNAFHSVSGFPRLVFLGSNTNQGTITNLFSGTFGAKHGTDTEFAGSGVLAYGINSYPADYGFFNNVVATNLQITGGTIASGKVLTSDASGNATWQTAGSGSSPLTTKGDLNTYSTTNTRLAVGTDGTTLIADSTATTGNKWGTALAGAYSIKGTGTTSATSALVVYDSSGSNRTATFTDNNTVVVGNAAADPDGWARFYVAGGGFRADDDFRFKKGSGSQYLTRSGGTGFNLVFQSPSDQITLYGAGGMEIHQTLKLSGAGTPGLNKVLTSDASGNATWQTPAGGGSGITRNISSGSTNITLPATALTDQVYICTGSSAYTVTLPTAASNTNQYTVSNQSTVVQSVATTSSQTINGSAAPISIPVGVSYDFIASSSNWYII